MELDAKKALESLRNQINNIDAEILNLLSKRREKSQEVIKTKNIKQLPIRDKNREEELLKSLVAFGKEKGLDSHLVLKIFSDIIEDSVRLQQKYVQKEVNKTSEENESLRIAIQGIYGSYSSLAAKKFFSDNADQIVFIGKHTFNEVVRAVEKGEAEYAMLPVENTTSGGINEVYDALLHTNLSIVGEEIFSVKHCLVGIENIHESKIRKIYAHPQAASQCSKFLAKIPDCQIEYYTDTAMSAQKIKELNDPTIAAIASKQAADVFELKVLAEEIANQEGNFTRFLIAARKAVAVDERIPSKTSLIMATEQKPGALVDVLFVFKKRNLNLTKLESRPIIGNPWEEMFYLDFIGNISDENIKDALDEIGRYTRFMKILGSYPSQEITRAKLKTPVFEEDIDDQQKAGNEVKKNESKKVKSYKLTSREYKSEDTIVKVKDVEIGGDNFIVMAGPCSVESEEQIMQCAREVNENGAHVLRGGCFKPRTSPYAFQGLGMEGVKYLHKAGKSYDLPIITEVLAIEQIEDVLPYTDIIQIGARNMQNFSLLKEVGRTSKPVMLKRGMMSSLEELLNATEYILAGGNRQVILCERGIRTFETATRNTLDLSAIPVLKELTHLPVIVDPSHAVGQRDKVIPLALAAKAVGAHGIMVEFHPDPSVAKSDGPQALYFSQFKSLMKKIYEI